MKELDLTVIIPAYRAEAFIFDSVCSKLAVLDSWNLEYELIVVFDGQLKENMPKLSSINHPSLAIAGYDVHKGKGYAVRHGWSLGKAKYISYIDADFDLEFGIILKMLKVAMVNGADIVYPNKYSPDSGLSSPITRKVMSRIYSYVVKLFFSIKAKDTQTGAKLYKREVISKIASLCKVNGYGFEIETFILAQKAGFKNFIDVPVNIAKTGQSKKSLAMVFGIIKDTLVVFYQSRLMS